MPPSGRARPPTSATSDSERIDDTRLRSLPRGADSDEPIAMVTVSSEPRVPPGTWPAPGRSAAGPASPRPGTNCSATSTSGPDAAVGPGARRHRAALRACPRNSPRRPICWATRPPAAATPAGSRPGGCTGCSSRPTPDRAPDAHLAQPLRDQPAQGRGRRGDARQNETFRRHARGPFGDLLRAMLRDPGPARLARRPVEPEGQAEREPRPRVDGAVHARRRPVSPSAT